MILTSQHVILPLVPSHYTYYHVEMLESNGLLTFVIAFVVVIPSSQKLRA